MDSFGAVQDRPLDSASNTSEERNDEEGQRYRGQSGTDSVGHSPTDYPTTPASVEARFSNYSSGHSANSTMSTINIPSSEEGQAAVMKMNDLLRRLPCDTPSPVERYAAIAVHEATLAEDSLAPLTRARSNHIDSHDRPASLRRKVMEQNLRQDGTGSNRSSIASCDSSKSRTSTQSSRGSVLSYDTQAKADLDLGEDEETDTYAGCRQTSIPPALRNMRDLLPMDRLNEESEQSPVVEDQHLSAHSKSSASDLQSSLAGHSDAGPTHVEEASGNSGDDTGMVQMNEFLIVMSSV